MPYIQVKDFKLGLDRRRKRIAGAPGTLWDIKNAHISRGGDIERAKKFVSQFALPAGVTKGLAQVRGQLYVFGDGSTPGGMPAGVQYQRLNPADGSTLTRVLDAKAFSGNLFVIAEFSNGQIRHFYNGTLLTDLDTLSDSNADFTSTADYLATKINSRSDVVASAYGSSVSITAVTPGTAFTISTSTVDGGGTNDQTATLTTLQANVSAVTEVRATGTVTVLGGSAGTGNSITALTAGVTSLIAAAVDWQTSNDITASLLAAAINNQGSISGYSAAAVGPIVTISAPTGSGATANGTVLTATVGGTVTASTANFAGGVTAVSPVAQVSQVTLGGTFQATDQFTATINGTT